jgi:hypothetical protein
LGEVHAGCRLERVLGRGGMGAVYLATAPDGQAVVVKFLAPDQARDAGLRARFGREWDALRKLAPHPHVVRVLDVASDPAPCIVLEYVRGEALDTRLERGPLPGRVGVEVARDLALGLAAVHAHGVLHRDVKPANVILQPDGRAKLVDFGLAKDLFLSGLTQPGQLLGTAYYMAPELWEEEVPADARADVFALGATLYHLLTGEPPFQGEDLDEIGDEIMEGCYEPLLERVPELPAELELAVARMLERDLRFRTSTMEAAARDLQCVLDGQPVDVPCLLGAGGLRFPLQIGEWFTLGSAAGAALQLSDPSVSPKHAQVRRQAAGFVLRDLKSQAGTWVAGERLAPGRARSLRSGEELRVGTVALRFHDPGEDAQASYLRDVERWTAPGELVAAVAALDDPHATLWCLEALAPPFAAWARLDAELGAELGAQARSFVEARQRHFAQRAAWAEERLRAITRLGLQGAGAWLSWWYQVRTTAPPQLVAPWRAPLRLRVVQEGQEPLDVSLRERSLVFVGRDEKCQARLDDADLPRLVATLFRLAERWVALPEGDLPAALDGQPLSGAAFLEAGRVLRVGPVEVVLELSGESRPESVDAASFAALEELGHASVVAALRAMTQPTPALAQASAALGTRAGVDWSAGLQRHLAQRAQHAQGLLPRIAQRPLRPRWPPSSTPG